jgi:hypothetical protein
MAATTNEFSFIDSICLQHSSSNVRGLTKILFKFDFYDNSFQKPKTQNTFPRLDQLTLLDCIPTKNKRKAGSAQIYSSTTL